MRCSQLAWPWANKRHTTTRAAVWQFCGWQSQGNAGIIISSTHIFQCPPCLRAVGVFKNHSGGGVPFFRELTEAICRRSPCRRPTDDGHQARVPLHPRRRLSARLAREAARASPRPHQTPARISVVARRHFFTTGGRPRGAGGGQLAVAGRDGVGARRANHGQDAGGAGTSVGGGRMGRRPSGRSGKQPGWGEEERARVGGALGEAQAGRPGGERRRREGGD